MQPLRKPVFPQFLFSFQLHFLRYLRVLDITLFIQVHFASFLLQSQREIIICQMASNPEATLVQQLNQGVGKQLTIVLWEMSSQARFSSSLSLLSFTSNPIQILSSNFILNFILGYPFKISVPMVQLPFYFKLNSKAQSWSYSQSINFSLNNI